MTRLSIVFAAVIAVLLGAAVPASAREVVDASAPIKTSVTVYRDPDRGVGEAMRRDLPRGFALISETRRVTLPSGVSTIRFTGVAEGMVAVSAIVTGLPGGTIEKNRNAELLSPAALVNGMLGNRITVTRTNPATGREESEDGIVRTRADGGLVLQMAQGYEAVRCAGLPERLTFPSVPDGLSPQPVFTIDTRDKAGGTYDITLSYLAWGFDWQAHYVATLDEPRDSNVVRMRLLSWLTILNDNGQTFADAELLAVAGTLNVESDFEELAEPPRAEPLRLTCFPIGSTTAGSAIPNFPANEREAEEYFADGSSIVVTGQRVAPEALAAVSDVAMVAIEEELGDLKLYRVPEPVSVNAQGQKQVAFINRPEVEGELLYETFCNPWSSLDGEVLTGAQMLFRTKNTEENGLGVAMPLGGMTVFEPSSKGDLLVAEPSLRDYAVGEDIELAIGSSAQLIGKCGRSGNVAPNDEGRPWVTMKLEVSNANPVRAELRLILGLASQWEVKGLRNLRLKDGNTVTEIRVPANSTRELIFRMRIAG